MNLIIMIIAVTKVRCVCDIKRGFIKDWDVVNGNHNELYPRSIQTWTMRVVTCFSIMLITFDQYLGWHGDYNLKTDIVDDMAIIISKFWCKYISDLDSGVSLNLRSGSQTGRQNSRWWWTVWWLCNACYVMMMMTMVMLAVEFRMIILWV